MTPSGQRVLSYVSGGRVRKFGIFVGPTLFLFNFVTVFGGGPLHPIPPDGGFLQWAPGVPVPYTLDPGALSDTVSAVIFSALRIKSNFGQA